MGIPSENKNQINRSRGETVGEAGADEPFGFEPKPHEHHQPSPRQGEEGLRGQDMRQGDLRDAAPRGSSHNRTLGEQRTEQQDAQHGADVRAPFLEAVDQTPEGLQRERTHPLNPRTGRGGDPDHVPNAPPTPPNLREH